MEYAWIANRDRKESMVIWLSILASGLACTQPVQAVNEPTAPDPPRAVLPANAPNGYPKAASLPEINKWLWEEYSRRATAEHNRAIAGRVVAPGSCGGCISVMVTPSVLPMNEWLALSERATNAMLAEDFKARLEGLNFVMHLQQAAMIGDLPQLLNAKLRSAVIKLMSDPDGEVRRLALGLQGQLREVASGSNLAEIAAAVDALLNPDVATRRAAVRALSDLTLGAKPETNAFGDLAPRIVERVLPLASDADRMTRLQSIAVLARTGEHAASLMPQFRQWLAGDDRLSRRAVYRAVESLGIDAAPLAPQLVELSNDGSYDDRAAAIRAIGYSRTCSDKAVAALTEIAQESDAMASSSARLSLARLGPNAATAAPALRAFAQSHPDAAKECVWAADVIEGKRSLQDPP